MGTAELFVSWAMCRLPPYNPDPKATQTYIEIQISVGDRLELNGDGKGANQGLFHSTQSGKERQIGFLSGQVGVGGSRSELKVSAVIRDPSEEKKDYEYVPCVKTRGWGYVVLVEGRHR